MEDGYRGPQVCKIVGITYRQLDYWARTGLVRPSLKEAKGSGTQRLYSFHDLVHLKVIKNLLDAGISLPQIRKAMDFLQRGLKEPLEKVTLMSDGSHIFAVTSQKEIIDVLQRGQGVFGIALGRVFQDIQGTLKDIVPPGERLPAQAGASGRS